MKRQAHYQCLQLLAAIEHFISKRMITVNYLKQTQIFELKSKCQHDIDIYERAINRLDLRYKQEMRVLNETQHGRVIKPSEK